MDEPEYHVVLHGKQVGPYSRRTIVGMRIRGTLGNDDAVLTSQGVQLTVADLVKKRELDNTFQPDRSGTYSLVQATYTASLLGVRGAGFEIPAFKGEVEARVQSEVLRISGRFRRGLGWKEDRVKLPLPAIAHARVRGSAVDLWLRPDPAAKGALQQLSLELFTPQDAGEFVDWLPRATPWTGGGAGADRTGAGPLVWGVVVGAVLLVGGLVLWVAMAIGRV